MAEGFNPVEWLTTQEAAELTGYDVTHIRWLIREDRVEGQKFGRDWMVNRRSIQNYTDAMKQLGSAKHDPWRTGARRKSK